MSRRRSKDSPLQERGPQDRDSGVLRLSTSAFRFEIGSDGRALSLKRAPEGPQLLSPSDQPIFSVVIDGTIRPLSKLSQENHGSRLIASSADEEVRAVFRVLRRPKHLAFLLESIQGVSYPLDLTMRLELAVTGMIGEIIACVHGGTDAAGLQGLGPYASGGAEARPAGAAVWVTLHLPKSGPAGGIALFACEGDGALDAIGQIEVAEGLPHPMAEGTWAKQSRVTRLSYLAADFSPDEIEDAIAFAQRAGLKILYLPPWIWASGEGSATPGIAGWTATLGHFGVNTTAFPEGRKGLRGLSDRAAAAGMAIGAHTMSAWISPTDSYVTPKPHPDLAAWARGTLAGDVAREATEIAIEGDGDFSPAQFARQGGWYSFQVARIGDELILYKGDVEGRNPSVLRGCTRGAHGTAAGPHHRGEEVRLLVQAYGHFVPDPESLLLREQAGQLADVMNECRLGITSFDGLESLNFRGDWGMNLFIEAVFRGWDHHVICDASLQKHYLWHMLSRGNWGENMIGLRDEVERRSRLENVALQQRNLMPPALGWWPLRVRTPDYEATNTDDFEYILAKCAGYDACFCIESHINVMQRHPQTGRILDLVKAWEGLRHAGAFTEAQKATLRTGGLDFRLDTAGAPWRVTPVKTDKPMYCTAPGRNAPPRVPVENPYHEQPLRFTIRILPGLDRHAAGSLSLLPGSASEMLPGPQPGPLAVQSAHSQTGAPAYRFTCDYSRRFEEVVPSPYGPKVRDTESSPPVRYHWTAASFRELPLFRGPVEWAVSQTAGARDEWILSHRRGLGMWLDAGDGSPGAMLFIELVDGAGRVRQYYAPLDEPGRRWVEWPNGEASADAYFDYEWARGPDCSIWHALKEFDYSRIRQVRVGMVRVASGTTATAVVEGLRAMPEAPAILSYPEFRLSRQTLVVRGAIESDHYLAYEGGESCDVYDENWGKVGEVPAQGRLEIPHGRSEVELAAKENELRPWLGIQMRVVGTGFEVCGMDG